ncbi:MAG: Glu/Leu/Phe/Val dehydrogenase dimerization domain-containing protein [Nocardioidaceae bacterium]
MSETQRAAVRPPYLQVTWHDPVTARRGYLVIDRLTRGVSSGGLRMREGCTLDEVRGLAAGMSMKEALHYRAENAYVPLGGAKGGIDCNPHDPAARGMLERYLQAMQALVERHWAFGEDLGLRQDTLDEVVVELGMTSSVQAVLRLLDNPKESLGRLASSCELVSGGLPLDELVGGLGVAESALTALERTGRRPSETTAVIQGLGSMGGATARFLHEAGVRVVGIADVHGLVANPAGLDVEALLRARNAHGEIDRAALRPDDEQLAGDKWLALPVDVLVPAAVSYCVTAENQQHISAGLIVEAANMPVLPEAEAALTARGVVIVPDVVANSATNAWWWWTVFGDVAADVNESFATVRTQLRGLVDEVFARADKDGTGLRTAAHALGEDRLASIAERYGDY